MTNEILDKFISKMSYLAVVFFKVGQHVKSKATSEYSQDEHPASTAALEVLEEIDDDLDEQGIVFVKLDDEVAKTNTTNKYIQIKIKQTNVTRN